jgi:beta-glucanase (GH16 family)
VLRRRAVLAELSALVGLPLGAGPLLAAARPDGTAPYAGMQPSFDYLPTRDGVALLQGSAVQAGGAARPVGDRKGTWQPRFPTEAAAKGHGNIWNGEYQFYADPGYRWSNGFTPFAVVDGALRIRAERTARLGFQPGEIPDDPLTGVTYEWVSGVLTSHRSFAQQGGYFEIDAKMPRGAATWPAFWLVPADKVHPPEIDVFEVLGHEPTKCRSNCISLGPSPDETTFDTGLDLSAGFHRYGCLWTDTAIEMFFDGVRTAIKPIAGRREYWQPFYLIVNLAIGSRKAEWVPAPDPSMPGPADLLVRSIRAWQKAGPRQVVLSSTAVPETAPVGTHVAQLSCVGADAAFRLLNGGSFTIAGDALITAAPLRFGTQPYQAAIIEATDGRGETWQQPVSITVLDEGLAPNALAAGSERLADPAWSKAGAAITDAGPAAELILEQPVTGIHAVEQLIPKPAVPWRCIISADLKPQGRDWVKFEVSSDSGKNVQAWFDVARAQVGNRFASADPSPKLNDCRATRLDDDFVRCQVDLTTDAGPSLRISLRLVLDDLNEDAHPGDPARGMVSRPPLRVVVIGPAR